MLMTALLLAGSWQLRGRRCLQPAHPRYPFVASRLQELYPLCINLTTAPGLRDVEKIIVATEILSKPGRLNVIEFKLIQGHAQAGYDVLKDIGFPRPVTQVALQHHERINSSGAGGNRTWARNTLRCGGRRCLSAAVQSAGVRDSGVVTDVGVVVTLIRTSFSKYSRITRRPAANRHTPIRQITAAPINGHCSP